MTATTWDPNNKSSGMTLSGGSLIATSSALANVAATRAMTGNSYFEVVVTTLGSGVISIGFVNRSYNMASGTILGTDLNGLGFKSGGTVVLNNATLTTIFTYTLADRIGAALDLERRLVWFTKNGTTWNNDIIANQNPVGHVGGIDYSTMNLPAVFPAAGVSATGDALTAAFTTTTYSVPTGYAIVDTCGATAARAYGSFTAPSTIGAQTTARMGYRGMGASTKAFTPAGALTTVQGTVKEGTTPVAKTVRAYDPNTGELLTSTTSDPASGAFSVPAVGRPTLDVVAHDPTTFQAQIFDRVPSS